MTKSFIAPSLPPPDMWNVVTAESVSIVFLAADQKQSQGEELFSSIGRPLVPCPSVCWYQKRFTTGNGLIEQIDRNRVHMNSVDCVYQWFRRASQHLSLLHRVPLRLAWVPLALFLAPVYHVLCCFSSRCIYLTFNESPGFSISSSNPEREGAVEGGSSDFKEQH